MSSGTDLGEGGGSVSIAVREGWEPSPDEIAGRAAFLEEIDILARRADPRVADVTAGVSEESRSIFVMNSSGAKASEEQTLCGLSATAYVKDGGKSQRGSFGGGGRESFESLAGGRLSSGTLAREAVRRAVVLLDAIEAPAGEWPVVIGNGWGGVLLHEAIGHGFEADFVRRGSSNYTGRVGQRVASEICTVIDDGSIRGLRGSYGVDDEGTPSRRTTLVRNGILVGYLHDLLSADALGQAPSGNGRRQSFRTPPLPRQSNIFLEAGSEDPEEILRSVHRGLFARSLGGGQVDIVNGNFVFQVTEGYLIEEGRITAPVIGASLIGTGHDILSKVARVGADFSFDPGVGTCGKDGQRQPVGVGQPTLLVSAMTVGGTRL
jgi:TldD protein